MSRESSLRLRSSSLLGSSIIVDEAKLVLTLEVARLAASTLRPRPNIVERLQSLRVLGKGGCLLLKEKVPSLASSAAAASTMEAVIVGSSEAVTEPQQL